MVAGQKIALRRVDAGKTVTIDVTDTTLAVERDDGARVFQRTNDQPVRTALLAAPRLLHRGMGRRGCGLPAPSALPRRHLRVLRRTVGRSAVRP